MKTTHRRYISDTILLAALAFSFSGCNGRYVCFPLSACRLDNRTYYLLGHLDSDAHRADPKYPMFKNRP